MPRRAAARAFVLTFALALTSCAAPAPPKDSLTVLLEGDILSIDPNQELEVITDSVLFNAYEPLVGLNEDLEVRTILAESWEHPRPEQWRFHLRKDVRFQDGTPLTADTVRESLLAVKSAAHLEASHFLSQIEEITTVDTHILDIVTHEPRAILANLPSLYVTRPNSKGTFPKVVGTGPYRVREWKRGERVVLERWQGYWGVSPEFREVTFAPVADAKARVARLAGGAADIVYGVPPDLAAKPVSGVRFLRRPGLTVFYLGFNVRRRPGNPFADVRVRRAFHLALDRKAIVDRVLLGAGTVATQPIAPLVFGYNPALPTPQRDLLGAKALLAEAGYVGGLEVRLDVPDARSDVAVVIQEQLRDAGVEVELNALARDAVYDLGKAGRSDFFFAGWDCSSGEASEFYEFCLHTPARRYGLGNYGGYSNPVIDEIAEGNPAVLDQRERRKMLERAAAVVMEDLPVVPLYGADNIYGVREGLVLRPRADGELQLTFVKYAPK